MKEIIRIMIAGGSGYGPESEAFSDKLTVTKDTIRYEYKPLIESDIHHGYKWSYKTNSSAFQKAFEEVSKSIGMILRWEGEIPFVTDIGSITFRVVFSDRTKESREFWLSGEDFKDCFTLVKRMVPKCETIPEVLRTSDDDYK